MMRTIIVGIILSLMCVEGTQAEENIRISVKNDQGQTIPFIYILVNGRGVTATDTVGLARIDAARLAIGDTISAICIDTEPAWVIFDDKIKKQGSCELVLKELYSTYSLDQIVVTPEDMEPFFAKHSINIFPPANNGTLTADFEAIITRPGLSAQRVTGHFLAENEIRGKNLSTPYQYGYFHHPIQFTTSDDTTQLRSLLDAHVRKALSGGMYNTAAFMMSGWSRNQAKKSYNMRFLYLGKSDSSMKFRALYIPHRENGYSAQTQLFISNITKSLVRSEFISSRSDGQTKNNSRINTDHYNHQFGRRAAVLLPKNISYYYDETSGLVLKISITDAAYQLK